MICAIFSKKYFDMETLFPYLLNIIPNLPLMRITIHPFARCIPVVPAAASLFVTLALSANAQVVWDNPSSTYPPDASQNWTIGTNWNTDTVPGSSSNISISNGGSALVNSVVTPISTVILGNSSNAALTHSLTIANGGTLEVTSTAASAFRIINTAGSHNLTVNTGGTLTVAGSLINGGASGTGRHRP